MSCSNCFIDLCEVLICDGLGTLKLPETAIISGTFVLVLKFQGVAISFDTVLSAGDQIEFELDCINENYCFEAHVYDPKGNVVIFYDANGSGDGVRFCTLQSAICN